MDILFTVFAVYLIVINIATFIVYGVDKSKARKNEWRISEKVLILLAVVGGSVGALLGMYAFHHKTQHFKFSIGVPLILVLQVVLAALFL